ncbi:MAG: hypothetical protein KDE55_18095 [Novosphingobium sp.]|nr:hypothetical protein [Novosphingobium sp.]
MPFVPPPPASYRDHPVWQGLVSHRFGIDGAALTFEARLARENGWTPVFSARVLEEYRRFCFMAVTAGHIVTPSDAVDQAWHLHLAYTHDYWDHFCPDVLGKTLHHGPTAGGEGELHRHFEQYARTLATYEAIFGPPPRDIWPEARRVLLEDGKARRVHPRDGFVVPRRVAYGVLTLLVLFLLLTVFLAFGSVD